MNHRHIKTWLLSEEPLLPDQVEALQAHLATCESCRSLAESWLEVKLLLNTRMSIQPAAGFAERWQERYIAQSIALSQRKQRQSWWFFLISAATASLLFILLIVQAVTSFNSPMDVILSGVYLVSGAIASLTTFQSLVITLLNTLISILSPFWWILLTGISCGLIIVWLISLRLVLSPRRISQ